MEENYVYIWKLCDLDVEKLEFSLPDQKIKPRHTIGLESEEGYLKMDGQMIL